jgi:hypothetical protein
MASHGVGPVRWAKLVRKGASRPPISAPFGTSLGQQVVTQASALGGASGLR